MRMVKKRLTRRDFELLPDPVWVEEDGALEPSPFFRRWWQQYAERRWGDKAKILEAALDLGYIARFYDPNTGKHHYDPVGFDYDPIQYRESLGIPTDMPLVSTAGSPDAYQRLWNNLLKEVTDG